MKKILWLALMIGCFVVPAVKAQDAAPAGAPPAAQGRKKRVAVFDFDFSTVGTTALARKWISEKASRICWCATWCRTAPIP